MWKREKEELRKQLDEISSSNKALDPLGHGQLTDTMAVGGIKKTPSNGGFNGKIIHKWWGSQLPCLTTEG